MFTANVWITWNSLGSGVRKKKKKEKNNACGREYKTWEEGSELQLAGEACLATKGKVDEETEKGKETEEAGWEGHVSTDAVIQEEKLSPTGGGWQGKQKAQNYRNFQKWFADCAEQVLKHT